MKGAARQNTAARRPVWVVLVLVAVTAAVYHPVAGFDFVNFDDPIWVSENPVMERGLSWEGVRWSFTRGTQRANYWVPMTWLSLFLDRAVYGMAPGGYHFTNLLLHLAAAALLFSVLRRLSGDLWPSALVAALFALHPLHVESVAWITERKDVLSGFFWMLCMGVYGWYGRSPGPARYGVLCGVFLLGLMAKPMLVTLPLVLVLLDYWPLGRWGRREPITGSFFGRPLVEKIPMFAAVAIIAAMTWITQAQGGAVKPLTEVSLGVRLANTLIAYAWYPVKMLWPARLAAIYPYPHAPSLWAAGGSGLCLAAVTALVIRWRRRVPFAAVGWLWYLVTLAPVSGLVVIGPHAVADRYSYIPLIGLFVLLAWAANGLAGRWRRRGRSGATGALALGLVLWLLVLAGLAHRQVGFWRDGVTLFTRALAVTPDAYLAHNNLGYALADAGRSAEAMTHFHRALELNPDGAEAHNGVGNLRLAAGDPSAALADFQQAMALDPSFAEPLNGAGNALLALGRTASAASLYRRAIALDSEFVQALNNLGQALVAQGDADSAAKAYGRALAIDPHFLPAKVNLASALVLLGRWEEAQERFRQVLASHPGSAPAAYSFALALEKRGDRAGAMQWYGRALAVDATFAPAANNLGILLAQAGRPRAAAAFFRQALAHAAGDGSIRENLRRATAAAAKEDHER